MIIVKIIGGLGNQMFQYAYAKALQQKGYDLKIDISEFDTYKLHGGYQLDKYNIDLLSSSEKENSKFYSKNIFLKILVKLKIFNINLIQEKSLLFDKTLLELNDEKYINGYFQCENYFKDIRNILLKQFEINQTITNYSMKIEKMILDSQNSCSMHIRRGDYINNQNISIHGVCSLNYYKKAINIVNSNFNNIKFFIFSDDIIWVKENLKIENSVYLDSKEKRIPHEDIYLMSICQHNIIANSSFSWWGAWLNQNNNKNVIAPKEWFASDKMQKKAQDIIPEQWIKV